MFRNKFFYGFMALLLATVACQLPSSAAPGDEPAPIVPVQSPTPTLSGLPTEAPPEVSINQIFVGIGQVVSMPAGFVMVGDADVCLDANGDECYRTYDSDGTTGTVVSFEANGYYVRLPFGDGTAIAIDQSALNDLVANQVVDGCGSGCTSGVTLFKVPAHLEQIKALAASFEPAATATPEPPTNWSTVTTLNAPPAPDQLPSVLMAAITYIAPPENCANDNDPNETCTTLQKQATSGFFTLSPNEAIVMTGDNINLCNGVCQTGDGVTTNVIVTSPAGGNKGDVWVLVNLDGSDVTPYMSAPHGSFRGFFTSGQWTQTRLEHLLNLHLQRYQIPDPDQPQEFNPTPCPTCNCIPTEGCVSSRVRVAYWNGTSWQEVLRGLYSKTTSPYWFPK